MPPSSRLTILRHGYALVVGGAAGLTAGLVGWGGAQVLIPSMTLPIPLASHSQLAATGISLTSLSLSSVSSGYRFWTDGRVDVPTALGIGVPALLSARAGTRLAQRMSGDALQLFFNGCSLLLIPCHFWIQQRRWSADKSAEDREPMPMESGERDPVSSEITYGDTEMDSCSDESNGNVASAMLNNPLTLRHASFGAFSGVLSALMGVGGLPLTMSYLTLSTDLPHHDVQGTAVVSLIPSIAMSAASRMAAVPAPAAACAAVGAFGGGLAGARIALHLPEERLRQLFMGSLCLFGGISMMGAARNMRRIFGRRL